MKIDEYAKIRLDSGKSRPYDKNKNADWAVFAARGVINDLLDRQGIKFGFEHVMPAVRNEIVRSLAAIIRLAAHEGGLTPVAADLPSSIHNFPCPDCQGTMYHFPTCKTRTSR